MSSIPRRRYLWAAGLVSLALVSACGTGEDAARDPKPSASTAQGDFPPPSRGAAVTVGLKKGQPGFSTKREGYQFVGFDKDLAEEVGNKVGFQPRYFDIPSLEREKYLEDNTTRMVVATYSITPTRDKSVDFTAPYLQTYQSLLVRDDDPRIKEVADADGKRICTATGSTSDPKSETKKKAQRTIKEELGENVKLRDRADYKQCVRGMQAGNFDAVWTDQILLKGFEEEYEGVHVVDNIEVGSPQLYGIGVRQGDREFCERVNKAVRDFVFSSRWRDTFSSHFGKVAQKNPGFQAKYRPTQAQFDSLDKRACGRAEKK